MCGVVKLCVCLMFIQLALGASNLVLLSASTKVERFTVPVSKYPILSWMDVQLGVYPNVTPIAGEVKIGSPATIMIYFNDKSQLYDVSVESCISFDARYIDDAKNKLILYENNRNITSKPLLNWMKSTPSYLQHTILLHSNFTAFKFPDRNVLHLTCNINICYNACK